MKYKTQKTMLFQLCGTCIHEFNAYIKSIDSAEYPNRYCESCSKLCTANYVEMDQEWINMMKRNRRTREYDTRSISSFRKVDFSNEQRKVNVSTADS